MIYWRKARTSGFFHLVVQCKRPCERSSYTLLTPSNKRHACCVELYYTSVEPFPTKWAERKIFLFSCEKCISFSSQYCSAHLINLLHIHKPLMPEKHRRIFRKHPPAINDSTKGMECCIVVRAWDYGS